MAQTVKRLSTVRETWVPWVGKIPWRRKWQPTPVLLPRKSHGRRSLGFMGSQRVGHHRVTSPNRWTARKSQCRALDGEKAPVTYATLLATSVTSPWSSGVPASASPSRFPCLRPTLRPSACLRIWAQFPICVCSHVFPGWFTFPPQTGSLRPMREGPCHPAHNPTSTLSF